MSEHGVLALRWLRLGAASMLRPTPVRTSGNPSLLVTCPHCTNVDTLSRHCVSSGCGWARCTCGALVYDRRRHRHPRHGSSRDTCHDPGAAA